jgi:class 3 adenylate cyclase
MDEIEQLKRSMAALEGQRAILGDAVVDAAVGSMREKLTGLEKAAEKKEATRRRKVISVLFADIAQAGSEGRPESREQRDAEELAEWMDELWARIDATIAAHGGLVDKHIGDTIMALWGVETTRAEDAGRAVSGALAMQQELAQFCRLRSLGLVMSVGINTGPVLVGSVGSSREFTVLGDTVNLAARLQQAAPPGRILISQETYRVVCGQFGLRAMAPLAIKGKSQPVQSYLVEP